MVRVKERIYQPRCFCRQVANSGTHISIHSRGIDDVVAEGGAEGSVQQFKEHFLSPLPPSFVTDCRR